MKLVITIELKRSKSNKHSANGDVDATNPGFLSWVPDDEDWEWHLPEGEPEPEDCPAGVNVASAALNRTGLGSSPRRGTQYLKEHVAFG